MYNNNTINEGYKTLSPEALSDEKLVEEYNNLVRLVEEDELEGMYEDFPDEEFFDYFNKVCEEYCHRNPELLLESDEGGWYTLSPFAWIGNIKLSGIGKIFAPLKWLAGLALAGLGLLLAGLMKALKEGKKQIAIARVRNWIERLVVIADGGYKKKKRDKDSLFLIQSRARRDILQSAVMLGFAAGLDIPQKSTQPSSVESAKNEQWSNNFYSKLNESQDWNFRGVKVAKVNGDEKQVPQALTSKIFRSKQELISALNQFGIGLAHVDLIGTTQNNAENNPNAWVTIFKKEYFEDSELADMGGQNVDDEEELDFNDSDIASFYWVQNKSANGEGGDGKEYPYTDEGIVQFFQDVSNVAGATVGENILDKNGLELIIKLKDGHQAEDTGVLIDELQRRFDDYCRLRQRDLNKRLNLSYAKEPTLPDDSQVDWSLLTTLKVSRWYDKFCFGIFGKKYKQNFWAEAKSVSKIDLEDVVDEASRQEYIQNILINCKTSLSKILTGSIANNYCNVINQYVQYVMSRDAQKSKIHDINRGDNRNAASGVRIGGGMNNANSSYQIALNPRTKLMNEETNFGGQNGTIMMQVTPEEYMRMRQGRNEVLEDIDANKNLIDNTFNKLQKIISLANFEELSIFIRTRDQMTNFLNELTKTVHTIIDSVAKKAQEGVNKSNNQPTSLISFLNDDKGDPKQNRTLRNLWDGIGRPKLDIREHDRLYDIFKSPEFTYFCQMLSTTIPLCITSLFVQNDQDGKNLIALVGKDGLKKSGLEVHLDSVEQKKKAAIGQLAQPEELQDISAFTNASKQDLENQGDDGSDNDNNPNNNQNAQSSNSNNDASSNTNPVPNNDNSGNTDSGTNNNNSEKYYTTQCKDDGFEEKYLNQTPSKQDVAILEVNGDTGTYKIPDDAETQNYLLTNLAYTAARVATIVEKPSGVAKKIETVTPGEIKKENDLWKITKKCEIKILG